MGTNSLKLRDALVPIYKVWRLSVKWLAILLTVFPCQTVLSQPTVTDIDMKSMYCVPIILSTRSALEMTVQFFQASMPNSQPLQQMKDELERMNTDINRLRSYLLLRARIVGPTVYTQAVKVAENRGHSDLADSKRCTDSCTDTTNKDGSPNFEKLDRCMANCKKKNSELFNRIQSCNVVNWLPF